MPARFQRHEDIPELVPGCLLIPPGQTDLVVPKEPAHDSVTTTPREVGYAFYTDSFHMGPERAVLDLFAENGKSFDTQLESGWGNHIGRVVMRVMLDSDRLAPVNMLRAYHNELALARYAHPDEERFFADFVDLHGVVDRSVYSNIKSGAA